MIKEIRYSAGSFTYYVHIDEHNKRQGEYKIWYDNNNMRLHTFFKDNKLHGEYKGWFKNGELDQHIFYKDDRDITELIEETVNNINNITDEEKLLIKMKSTASLQEYLQLTNNFNDSCSTVIINPVRFRVSRKTLCLIGTKTKIRRLAQKDKIWKSCLNRLQRMIKESISEEKTASWRLATKDLNYKDGSKF